MVDSFLGDNPRGIMNQQLENNSPHPPLSARSTGLAALVENARHALSLTCMESTHALVAAVEAKDPHTRAHSHTVAKYAVAIGTKLQLPPAELATLRTAALLHDIGKIGIPDAILTKPGPLTADEKRIVQRHPEAALEIIRGVSFLSAERPLILHHHERYDGTGYPARLKGDEIPLGARIIAIADALDAMLSTRSYKPAYDLPRVRAEITAGSCRQFDPLVARAAFALLNDLESLPD